MASSPLPFSGTSRSAHGGLSKEYMTPKAYIRLVTGASLEAWMDVSQFAVTTAAKSNAWNVL